MLDTLNRKIEGGAVVILSGGQDSATCLGYAVSRFTKVAAINFVYGQRHAVEENYALKQANLYNVSLEVVDISSMMELNESALLTKDKDVSAFTDKGLPDSFVPNRNQMFITIAHAYAQKLGYDYLVTGVCQTDYSGYPDCRLEFVEAIQKATNLGSGANISILTPLMYLTKEETFELADGMGILDSIIENTITCYNGDETLHEWGRGCGECPSCKLREKGYAEFRQAVGKG